MTDEPTVASRRDVSTTFVGVVVAVVSLGLAVLTGLALDRLATGHVAVGVALLAAVLVGRWLSAEGLERWYVASAQRIREEWRRRMLSFFVVPTPLSGPSPVDLVSAVDAVVDEPRLGVVRVGAQASILALVLVFLTGGWQAIAIVVVLLGVAVPLYQRAGQRAAQFDVHYRERRSRLGERQLELLRHAPEVRALGAVAYAGREIGALSASEHQVALRAIRSALGSSLVTEFLGGVSVGLVAMDVGFGLLHGHLSLLRALVCVLVTSEFFGHVRRYGVEFHRREAIESAKGYLTTPQIVDSAPADVLDVVDLVTMAHPGPVSLSIRPGQRVAVLGKSGVGKTTLAHTMMGWRAPRAGQVRRTAGAVAYVSADSSLIEGTVAQNLRLGREVTDARLRELLDALQLSGDHFSSLDAPVTADGDGFSSGERVRLLLARALVGEPRLLILDDVAGLLDTAAQQAIRATLALRHDMAIIEISVDETIFISTTTKVHLP